MGAFWHILPPHPLSWWHHQWKHFPRHWPFMWGIHRSPVISPHKGQWHRALLFSLICVWTNSWINNRDAGDLRHHHAHYDINAMNSDGHWKMTTSIVTRNCKFQASSRCSFNHHSPVFSHHSPVFSHHSPVFIHHSPVFIHHNPVFIHHSPVFSHHSPNFNNRSPVLVTIVLFLVTIVLVLVTIVLAVVIEPISSVPLISPSVVLNTLGPRQNGRHFPDDIFKCIFVNKKAWIFIKISLKFVP